MRHRFIESEFRKEWFGLIGRNNGSEAAVEDIIRRYNEPSRHYHDLSHIWLINEQQKNLGLEESANQKLFFSGAYHDIIDPIKPGNRSVLLSAGYAVMQSSLLGFDNKFSRSVCGQIIVTDHKTAPKNLLEQYQVDLDLTIFGMTGRLFDKYNQNIRKEFYFVPEEFYKEKRQQALSYFLAKEHIYYTRQFRKLYEEKARENLIRAIKKLRC